MLVVMVEQFTLQPVLLIIKLNIQSLTIAVQVTMEEPYLLEEAVVISQLTISAVTTLPVKVFMIQRFRVKMPIHIPMVE